MIFDITKYGAVSDGKTPATAAIQKAMDDAAKVGGIVEIPAGHWACGYVHVPAGIEVRGTYTWNWSFHHEYGFAGSILELCDTSVPCMFDMTDARGTTINGLSLDGRHAGENIHGILVDHTAYGDGDDGIKLENDKVAYFSGDSVRVRYIRGLFVRHSMLCFSVGWSLSVIGRDVFVIDNWLSGSMQTGNFALLGDAENIMLSANRIEDPRENGRDVDLYAPGENDPKIGARSVSLVNNYLCGSKQYGIAAIAGEGAVLDGISIIGNVFDSNGQFRGREESTHLRVEGCRNVLISQNAFFTKRGFWDPNSYLNTLYCVVLGKNTNLYMTENATNNAAQLKDIKYLEGNTGDVVVCDNAGREIAHEEGYMFPFWNMPQFPDAKRDEAAIHAFD